MVSDKFNEYANSVYSKLREYGIRVKLELEQQSLVIFFTFLNF